MSDKDINIDLFDQYLQQRLTDAEREKFDERLLNDGIYFYLQLMIVPVLQSFGLIFKDKFEAINMSATDASLILNLNSALGMTLGLVNGVLLKQFGFRKIAFLGGALFSSGLIATSWANTFSHFLVTYSIITCELLQTCFSQTKIK